MRIIIVYKEESDHAREVNIWIHDFESRTGFEVERIEPETRDGTDFCRAYDIVEYPTILAITSTTGELQQHWRGRPLPMIADVSYYLTI